MTALSDRLRALMQDKGLTTEDLGKAAGIEAGTVEQILRGEIARPPDERLRGFVNALGVSFDSLLRLIPAELREARAPFLEALDAAAGRKWRIVVIRAGLSGNGNFYPDASLRAAIPLFEGARVFAKSDDEHLRGQGKDFRNLIGRVTGVRFVEGQERDQGELQATLDVLESAGDIATKIREAWQRGMAGLFGFSIDALGTTRSGTIGGRRVRIATAFREVKSVDLIVEPGAGGQIINLIESQAGSTTVYLTEAQIETQVRASTLPKPAQDRVIKSYGHPAQVTEPELREAIVSERSYLASVSDSGRVTGLGDDLPRVQLIEGRDEKIDRMLDAFFDPNDSSVTSIKECYVEITGDKRVTGLLRHCDQARLREALSSGSFGAVLGDSITRRMVADYRTPDVYAVWRNLVNVVPVQDFRVQERTRFGGYGDLPIVAERDPYLSFTSPSDEKATYQVAKRGGIETVSLEMIKNDDAGAVQRIPVKLSRAAKRTVSKFVLDTLSTNPVIFNTKALFHADHNNLGAAALSAASVAVGRLAMKRQPELNSNDRLGIGPRYLWVPDDLEETAVDLFRRNTENDKTFVQSLSLDVMPVWYWTDANDWFLSADSADIPSVEVGFLDGQEEPEVFIQDQPTQGSVFSHDIISYKIRHIYGLTVTDFRGLYGAIVA